MNTVPNNPFPVEYPASYAGEHPHRESGKQYRFFFPNGYGASVVRGPHSYGNEQGLWELAVLAGDDNDYCLCYDTRITDDVLGHLDEGSVAQTLERVRALPRTTTARRAGS